MIRSDTKTAALALSIAVTTAIGLSLAAPENVAGGAGNPSPHEGISKGPHGGRLLGDDRLALEVTIHEAGVPPELQVHAYAGGKPIDPDAVELRIDLHRFGGRVDEVRFRKRDDYLVGDREVEEPHSFEVRVAATYAGETQQWRYESLEGRTEISPEAGAASGIVIATAGPATIQTTLRLPGRIVPNEDRVARIGARFPGVVQALHARPGDRVAEGDLLAVVESNESMRPYEIRSPIPGTVLARNVSPGQIAGGDHRDLYVIADLSTLWVDLAVPPEMAAQLRSGQRARTLPTPGSDGVEGRLIYLAPFGSETTQTLLARAELPNPDGKLRPGLFATVEVTIEESMVPVAVDPAALQSFRDRTVVYLTDGRTYQAMPVDVGRRDESAVEIRSGIAAGQRYAAAGSFVVKADVGKSGATHDH